MKDSLTKREILIDGVPRKMRVKVYDGLCTYIVEMRGGLIDISMGKALSDKEIAEEVRGFLNAF